MGWQGRVHRRQELERIAEFFKKGAWWEIKVACWRDDDKYWIWFPDQEKPVRVWRDDLSPAPYH